MLTFAQSAFDGYVVGTGNVYSLTDISELLGSTDVLHVSAVALAVTGTNPTLTVQIENSFDGTRWQNQSSTAELNAQSLGAGDNAPFFFVTSSSPLGRAARVRLRIALGGTSPTALLRIRAAGRDPAGV